MASEQHNDASQAPVIKIPTGQEVSQYEQEAVISADLNSLPPGYFTSTFFLGTMVASGLAIAGVSRRRNHCPGLIDY